MAPTPRHVRTLGVLSCLALFLAGAPALAGVRPSDREAAALDLLERAVRAARTVGYSGTQYVASWSAGTSTSTLADVAHDPSSGAVVTAGSPEGADSGTPVALAPARLDQQLLDVLAGQYDLVVAGSAQCTGRAASVVEARRAGVQGDGAVAGRLWLDRDSGLLLRREVYDDAGRRVRSSAFLDVAIGSGVAASPPADADAVRSPNAADAVTAGQRAMTLPVTTGEPVSGLERLRRHDWQAPDRLPRGFLLVDVDLSGGEGAGQGTPSLAHLTYSDGLSTVSLFAQRGTLGDGPGGSFRPASMAGAPVWMHSASPTRVVWSGGGQVWTLIADAPSEVVEAAVVALPHDAPQSDGVLPRLRRGLARIGAAVNPFG